MMRIDKTETRSGLSSTKRLLLEKRLRGTFRGASRVQTIGKRPEGIEIPLSFAQQRLWFLDKFKPGSPFYSVPIAVRLEGRLDREALGRSLDEIVHRHESLRTSFPAVDGRPYQSIRDDLSLDMQLVDLRGLSVSRREECARELATGDARRPFDLAQGPLIRASLLKLDEQDHVFLLNMHHIVSDGWSLNLFMKELGELYDAYVSGRAPSLPLLAVQYADYAYWQRAWLTGDVLSSQLEYWKEMLSGCPGILDMPTDRPRPAVQTYNGARAYVQLPRRLLRTLRKFGVREDATLFMTLLAAFKLLLYRYTGQRHIVVGTPIANRNRAEIENVIGFFVNMLVLRTDLSGDPVFRELLGRVREVALGAYAHQDIPFEKLVEELEPERDMSHTPLFQVVFALQNVPEQSFALTGLRMKPFDAGADTAKFDLALLLTEQGEDVWGTLAYNNDLFDESTATRMVEHYVRLLEGISGDADKRISEYELLCDRERVRLLVERNETVVAHPRGRCVHELFEECAGRCGDAVAVVQGDRRMSYRELNGRANRLAHYLMGLGVGCEDVVGIYMERSIEVIVGILGVLKAGGAYVPLDVGYPRERVEYMVRDAGIRVLLTQERLRGSVAVEGVRVVSVDSGWSEISVVGGGGDPCVGVSTGNLAYVIYTSGSTGRPKGVMIEHEGLVNLVYWHRRVYGVTERDRVTQVSGLSFDLSVWEIFPCITAGASIHIPDEETRLSPRRLVKWLVDEGITVSILPTPVAEAILEERWPTDSRMRMMLTGGDKLHRAPRETIPFRLYNNYGPTESTVLATWAPVVPGGGDGRVPPIGRPIDNMKVYLLDEFLNPVPEGIAGELYISGIGLGRGYLDRPDMTAEVFVPDPFSSGRGVRMYRTGDVARYGEGGQIEYLGRRDGQVKIRGYRIELGEVEVVLGGHPGVREAVVRVWEGEGGSQLVGYVVVRGGEAVPRISELRGYLRERLPEYMVPSTIVTLGSLPLTPNGKVDRSALPKPDSMRHNLVSAFVAPGTEVENAIAQVWKDVLKLETVGINDNFFDLGGHSLLLIQVNSRLQQMFNREISVIEMFRYTTIRSLAGYISRRQDEQRQRMEGRERARARIHSMERRRQVR